MIRRQRACDRMLRRKYLHRNHLLSPPPLSLSTLPGYLALVGPWVERIWPGTVAISLDKHPVKTKTLTSVPLFPILRVPKRYSSGAQHTGRGGAGNVVREHEELSELARQTSKEQAIEDDSSDAAAAPTAASPDADLTAAKRKHWLFGKKG